MHPKSPIAVTTLEGDNVFYAREDVVKMCFNYKVTSLKHAPKHDYYDGILDMVEDRGEPGFSRWDNAKLAEHWNDIKEEYEFAREEGKLVFDHKDPEIVPAEFPAHTLKIQGLDNVEIEIDRNALIERLTLTAVAEAINSWEDHEDTDFISYTKLEGCTGFNNMSDDELIAEWDDCREVFYRKASTGNLKSDIPDTDPEKDVIPALPWLPWKAQP